MKHVPVVALNRSVTATINASGPSELLIVEGRAKYVAMRITAITTLTIRSLSL